MEKQTIIQHLFARAGFGLSPQEWQARKDWSKAQALHEIFGEKIQSIPVLVSMPLPQKDMTQEQRMERQKRQRELTGNENINWITRMGSPKESAFLERMTLFWHGHFACETQIAYLAAQQINSIRKHALGNFRELVLAIAKDPSMIRYLNNQQNRKKKPNENFARELMELFTIGRGNYSQKDIKEAARAFTGWAHNQKGEYIFRKGQHDYEQKTFMGQMGNFNGDEIIDLILKKRETAVFITRKVYKYFVNENIEENRVKNLANDFYDSNYNILKLMYAIFNSDWFYDAENIGTKIKSPVELIAGFMRQTNASNFTKQGLLYTQKALGQILFKPPNVAGWAGGKNWIDNSTLTTRLNFTTIVIQASELAANNEHKKLKKRQIKRFQATLDFEPIFELVEGKEDAAIIKTLTEYLIHPPLTVPKKIVQNFSKNENRSTFIKNVCRRLMGLPEYQMC